MTVSKVALDFFDVYNFEWKGLKKISSHNLFLPIFQFLNDSNNIIIFIFIYLSQQDSERKVFWSTHFTGRKASITLTPHTAWPKLSYLEFPIIMCGVSQILKIGQQFWNLAVWTRH